MQKSELEDEEKKDIKENILEERSEEGEQHKQGRKGNEKANMHFYSYCIFMLYFHSKNVSDLYNKGKRQFQSYISNTTILFRKLNNSEKCIRDCIVVFEATACSLMESAKRKSTFIKFMYYFAFSSVQLWHFSICIFC